ncbi:unnamed protein product, partial [Ectocarpus sp. 4 AP-2014]
VVLRQGYTVLAHHTRHCCHQVPVDKRCQLSHFSCCVNFVENVSQGVKRHLHHLFGGIRSFQFVLTGAMILHKNHVASVAVLVMQFCEPSLECVLNSSEVRIRDARWAVHLDIAHKTPS